MIGPVYNASHTQPSALSFVLSEAIGTAFIYVSFFGLRRAPSPLSRIINLLAFLVVGVALVVVSVLELHRMGESDSIGIVTFLATAGPLGGLRLVRWLKFRGSAAWPTTQGTVESSMVREVRTKSAHYFLVEVSYSYQINEEYYSGRFVKQFEKESDASDFADATRVKSLVVKFNGARVECSSVEDKDAEPL